MKYTPNIIGFASAFPKKCVTNFDLEKSLDTSNEWIVKRTGIKQRYISDASETTSYLGAKAANEALLKANLDPSEIDLIVLATTTPDDIFPSTATKIQSIIGAHNAVSFDIQAACSGFIFALETASNFLSTGKYFNAIVIGSDTYSKILDWSDRSTCVLFGDGAGAFVISTKTEGHKILKTKIFSNGNNYLDLKATYENTKTGFGKIVMNGREVYKAGISNMIYAVKELHADRIDLLIPHQANLRMIESLAENLSFSMDKVVVNVDEYANTSAATIPTAYCKAKFKKNDHVVLVGMGAGFTYGSALIEI